MSCLIKVGVFLLVLSLGSLTASSQPATPDPGPPDPGTPAASFVQPVPAQDAPLYVFNLEDYLATRPDDKVWQYDVVMFLAALQGLVNRQQPQLYLLYVREEYSSHRLNVDEYYLEMLTGQNGFLNDKTIIEITELEDLVNIFRSYFSALVIWDPEVPATANVAMTIAGADALLPVRFDNSPGSLLNQIHVNGPMVPVLENLHNKFIGVGNLPLPSGVMEQAETTGYQKGDAYAWASELYQVTGRTSPTHLAYYLDAYDWDPNVNGVQYPDLLDCQLSNRDFYVGKGAFFVDLDPWWDEVPSDIPFNQFMRGFDNRTLKRIMQDAYDNTLGNDRLLRIGGFVPWWIKYTTQTIFGEARTSKDAINTAEEFVSIMSAYNGVVDADSWPFAEMANASVFQHSPLEPRYEQNPTPMARPLEDKNYLLFVIGDFRSSAMLYQTMPHLWDDSNRGTIPIGWAIAPMLSERVPHIFDYMYRTRTSNDYFMGAGNGAGLTYLNRLFPPRLHSTISLSGLPFLHQWSNRLYTQFDLRSLVAADLDREDDRNVMYSQDLQEFFLRIAPHGVSTLKPFQRTLINQLIPFSVEENYIDARLPVLDEIIDLIISDAQTGEPNFQMYRFNLASPTTLTYIWNGLQQRRPDLNFDLVDPFTFFYLHRQYYAGGDPTANHCMPTFISDTVQREMQAGLEYSPRITLRNDGWDTWNPQDIPSENRHRLVYRWYDANGNPVDEFYRHAAYVDRQVLPGDTLTLSLFLEMPEEFDALYEIEFLFEQQNRKQSPITYRFPVAVLQTLDLN